jgi:histidinol dehydrogenase
MDLLGGSIDLRTLVPRAEMDVEAAVAAVRPICEDVRLRGEEALIEYGEHFDGVRLQSVRVAREAMGQALAELDPQVRSALEESIRRARKVHTDQRRRDVRTQVVPGGAVTERWIPVDRVGLYVPGGRAVYPSSVVMNVVPAQIAGVGAIAVASPPQKDFDGLPHPTILAACALLGVDEVYAVGGAQAVAMFAYGAGQGATRCAPVDLVTGPGNIYVVAAKRLLKGRIGIDAEAGPTEIMVLADLSASPAHVAADLISQAEHDPLAAAVLVTDSPALAEAVGLELATQVPRTKHSERIAVALAGRQSAIVLVDDLEAGLAVANAYAAEHLEIQTSNARVVAGRVRNAGAVFVGPYSPVSLGDYCAGSNHVLPTGGCACHSSGLSVQSFLRGIHIVEYSDSALAEVAHHVVALATAEDLPAHGEAVAIRFPQEKPQAAEVSGAAVSTPGGDVPVSEYPEFEAAAFHDPSPDVAAANEPAFDDAAFGDAAFDDAAFNRFIAAAPDQSEPQETQQ